MLDRTFQAEIVDEILVVRGDVDDYGIITLRNLLAEHGTRPGGRLAVDLSGVDYLPSVAVGVLTKAIAAADRSGSQVDLVARRGSVAQRVLMVCALPYVESADDEGDPPESDVPA